MSACVRVLARPLFERACVNAKYVWSYSEGVCERVCARVCVFVCVCVSTSVCVQIVVVRVRVRVCTTVMVVRNECVRVRVSQWQTR